MTKREKEFFDRFARNIIVNTVLLQLQAQGVENDVEVTEKIIAVVDTADVSLLSKAVADKLLETVDFPTLLKVEKFLVSPDAQRAMLAAQQVGSAVQDEVFAVIGQVFGDSAVQE